MTAANAPTVARARKQLESFVDGCIDCGICKVNCSFQASQNLTIGEMFQEVLDAAPSAETVRFIGRCALCGLCSEQCLVNLSVPRAVMAARQVLLETGVTNLDDYQALLIDRDAHLFTLYRDTYGIRYDDLKKPRSGTIFFPGCTLSSYAPELTRAAYAWLEAREEQVGFSEECCGAPLVSIGLAERDVHFAARLQEQFESVGAKRVVTACPECYSHLKDTAAGAQVISLYEVMEQEHVRIRMEEVLTVHDSCPDRHGHISAAVRHLLVAPRVVEMRHHGATTRCCGSGGIVSVIDPELCNERARTRLAEFKETQADACVTACMACAHRLARGGEQARIGHILEFAFGLRVDYAQVQARAKAMWEGDRGARNLERLAAAQIV